MSRADAVHRHEAFFAHLDLGVVVHNKVAESGRAPAGSLLCPVPHHLPDVHHLLDVAVLQVSRTKVPEGLEDSFYTLLCHLRKAAITTRCP